MATGLSAKQRAFVIEYLVDLNGTQAAVRAGYAPGKNFKAAGVAATRLLANDRIQAAIQEQRQATEKRTHITADRVLQEYARVAFFDPKNIFGEDGKPLPLVDIDEDTRRAVCGLDVVFVGNAETGVGEIQKIKIASKLAALDALSKHLGIYEQDNKQKGVAAIAALAELCRASQPMAIPSEEG